MGSIFISYRRDDSADVTGRIYDRLIARFGKGSIFKDVDSIPAGVDFRTQLHEALHGCSAVVVIIGDRWLDTADHAGARRLDQADDFVRAEIETALHRNIIVVPVLVRGARVPSSADLPHSLRDLAFRQAIQVRPDPDFNRDVGTLIDELAKVVGSSPEPAAELALEVPAVTTPRLRSALLDPTGPLVLFTTYASIAVAPMCVVFWLITGGAWTRATWSGLAASLLFGAILTPLYRGAALDVGFSDRTAFVARLKGAMGELGGLCRSETESFLAFAIDWKNGLLAGRISVRLSRSSAHITGPKIFLTKLRQRLSESF